MSKHLTKVFAGMPHVSFLATIPTEPQKECPSIDILVEEVDDEGKYHDENTPMLIKLWEATGECRQYELSMQQGCGRLCIDDCMCPIRIQLVDADETAIEKITYYVNDEKQEADAAIVQGGEEKKICVRMVYCHEAYASLTLTKSLRLIDGTCCQPLNDMEFFIRLTHTDGSNYFFTLHEENQFCEQIQGLKVGEYQIEERTNGSYQPCFYLDGEPLVSTQCFMLTKGEHTVEIINAKAMHTQFQISRYVRNAYGELCKPYGETIEMLLISERGQNSLCFCDENDFCVQIQGLDAGCYELCEQAMASNISYLVNDEPESKRACIELCEGGCDDIVVIESPCDKQAQPSFSSLRICKYIRSGGGRLVRPSEEYQYKVQVRGCGTCDAFYLNANNNFCVDLANVCPGEYCVEEIGCEDFVTSYSINGGLEKTSAEFCYDGEHGICVSIINEAKNRGSVCISKYIRDAQGNLLQPSKDSVFRATLSSYFMRQCFELKAENNFTVCFDDLRFGSYEIREEVQCDFETGYQIDCGRLKSNGRFVIDNCFEHEVKIINALPCRETYSLRISKFVETLSAQLVKPAGDEVFKVWVHGEDFSETYCLKASNNWQLQLEGLREGCYQVEEVGCENSDISYIVNHQPCKEACVCLKNCNQEVVIINHAAEMGTITLKAVVKNCDGEIIEPPCDARFEVLVEGKEGCYQACLCRDNDWCFALDDVCCGKYRIIQKDNFGYRVSYYIQGRLDSFGKLRMGSEDESVVIINEETDCSGNVIVTKYVENDQGQLVLPMTDSTYCFALCNDAGMQEYTLDQQNDFCVYFDDLPKGAYEIVEQGGGEQVRYQIDGSEVERACFTLAKQDIHIDIINMEKTAKPLHICKKICDGKQWKLPDASQCYHILLKGKKTHEIYELNAENNFAISLCDLRKQHYEIKELHAQGNVSYYVNGSCQEDGYFLYNGEETEIEIVNEEHALAGIEIRKMVCDAYGDLRRPSSHDTFEVMIESESFKQKLTLCDENDFTIHLFDMPRDHYEIWECGNHAVRYLINDLPYERACIDVGDEDVYVTIVNYPCPRGSLHFIADTNCATDPLCFQVQSKAFCETITLDATHHFQASLCDLQPDSYLVEGDDDICFTMHGQCFDQHVCIELQGEDVEVCVMRKEKRQSELFVQKWLQDDEGRRKPFHDTCYDMVLCAKDWEKSFQLCANQDFKACFMLEEGSYELKECNGQAKYCINQGELRKKACFEACGDPISIDVINEMPKAVLHLGVCVQACDGTMEKPQGDLSFLMEITKQGQKIKRVVLDAENDWSKSIELPYGDYEITQLPHEQFAGVQYMVCEELCEQACIHLEADMCITGINEAMCAMGSIEISKLIKEQDRYHYPPQDAQYYVQLIGEQETIRTLLYADNGFYANISNLARGTYEVVEENSDETTAYIVNNAALSKQGIVHVADNANTVHIINTVEEKMGSIVLQKKLRENDQLHTPQDSDRFTFLISRPGYRQTVSLDAANQWQTVLSDLASGDYVISEIDTDADVSFIIDGGSEVNRAVVHVDGTSHQVQIINEYKKVVNGLRIQKRMRDSEGNFHTPNEDMRIRLRVTSPGFYELVTLSKENDWQIVFEDLNTGWYVVDEIDAQGKVSYIADHGSEKDHGVILVHDGMHSMEVINASEQQSLGSLQIEKMIRTAQGLKRPQDDFTALIYVHKPGFQRVITLDKENQWSAKIEDLANGLYAIEEIGATQRVSYIVNGEKESEHAEISVENNAHHVLVINEESNGDASLSIRKRIRAANGNLVAPQLEESFQVEVYQEAQLFQTLTLNRQNHWQQTLEHLPQGSYEIKEVSDLDYDVSYILDDGQEQERAVVELDHGAHRVQILNSRMRDSGHLTLTKHIQNADGSIMKPADGDEFVVRVFSEEYERLVPLNNGNDFEALVEGLPDGQYGILEIQNAAYLTTYRINNGPQQASATIGMAPNVSHHVDVINELRGNRNTIEVFKYMLDADGNYLPPTAPDVYSFTITGLDNDVSETYELNVENSWHQSIRTLPSGRYQVQESGGSPYSVKYLINSAQLMEEAIFEATAGSTQVIGIINTQANDGKGTLSISKRIRDANGSLSVPQNGEVFTVVLSGGDYQQTITLEPNNNYQFTVYDLPFGSYQVGEVTSDYEVSYRANDGSESAQGNIEINATAVNTMLIINTPIASVIKRSSTPIRVVIE